MSVDKQQNNSVAVSEKRRKLLKASAITPLVATITFGTGQAAAASAYQCMDDTVPNAPNERLHDLSGDDEAAAFGDIHSGIDGSSRMLVHKFTHSSDPVLYQVDNSNDYYYANTNSVTPIPAGYTQVDDVDVSMLYTSDNGGTTVIIEGPWPKTNTGKALFDSCIDSIIAVNNNSFSKNIV